MGPLARAINQLAKNPLWTFSWAVFGFCVLYIANQAYEMPERDAAFQRKNTELTNLRGEVQRAEVIVTLWRATISELQASFARYDETLRARPLSAKEQRAAIVETRRRYSAMREVLSTPLAVLNNTAFESSPLQELRTKLIADLNAMDALADKRVQLMSLVLTDEKKAQAMLEEMKSDTGEKRTLLETSSRALLIDGALETAKRQYADALAEGRAQMRRSTIDQYGVFAAALFVGGFIGALVRNFRLRRRMSKTTGAPAATSPAGDDR